MKLIATLFALITLTASPALANPPCPFQQGCLWQQCQDVATGGETLCVYPKAAGGGQPIVTPPSVFAPPVATIGPANAPVQQVAPGVIQCAGNACLDPDAGKFCGIHWCIWLLGGAILAGLVGLYLIMSRIRLATALGDYRGHVAHWNIIVDEHGAPLPGTSRVVMIEVAKALEAAWAEVNALDWMRFLRIQDNAMTNRPGHVAPRGLPPTAGAGATGTTP